MSTIVEARTVDAPADREAFADRLEELAGDDAVPAVPEDAGDPRAR